MLSAASITGCGGFSLTGGRRRPGKHCDHAVDGRAHARVRVALSPTCVLCLFFLFCFGFTFFFWLLWQFPVFPGFCSGRAARALTSLMDCTACV